MKSDLSFVCFWISFHEVIVIICAGYLPQLFELIIDIFNRSLVEYDVSYCCVSDENVNSYRIEIARSYL